MWIQTTTLLLVFINLGNSATTKFPPSYQFGYTVSDKASGDFKSHHEESDGSEVRGRYSLVEPSGDLRVVTYKADRANGFRAVVNVQPTPTYHLIQLPSLQKLGRQHVEPTETSVAADNENIGDLEQTMAVVREDPLKNASQSEYGGTDEKNTFDKEHVDNLGPQMIAVKIQEESLENVPRKQEPVLTIEVTSEKPVSTEEEEIVGPTNGNTEVQNKTTVSTSDFQITVMDNDNHTSLFDSHKINNDPQNVIKSMVEIKSENSNTQPFSQPSFENLFTTMDYFKSPENRPSEIKKPDIMQTSTNKSIEKTNIHNKQKPNTGVSEITNNSENMNMEDVRQNNMMLAALLLPTTPILKFTCTPDHSDKYNMPMVPTTSNFATLANQRSPQPAPFGPGGFIHTSSIPLLPFQFVNFSPIKQIFNPQNKFTPQKPLPIFATNTPFLSAISTVFPSKQPTVTTTLQQSPELVHKEDVSTKQKPPSGYTNVRANQAHHFLPSPWAPHPLRPAQHNYRHMPIFVMPMSHNSNFAPVFNPSLTDQNNQ